MHTLGEQSQPTGTSTGVNQLVNLVDLNVSSNCLVSLDGLQSLTKLQRIDLSYNMISSATEVAKLGLNPNLRELSLKGNPIANRR